MTEMRFDGKVALVTGAGAGMGRVHAEFLAARGAMVVVSDVGTSTDGDGADATVAAQVADAIVAAGGQASGYAADLGDDEGARGAVAHAVERFGGLDILIHNAGIALNGAFADETAERMDKLLGVNTRAACILARAAWPLMTGRGHGRIVLIGSTAMYGMAGAAHYAMSKASYLGLTRSLAEEGAAAGIKVNLVGPAGATRLADTMPDSEFKRWFFATMRNELVTPIVAYLAHRDCAVSGEAFFAGGGRLARIVLGERGVVIDRDLVAETVPRLVEEMMADDGPVRTYATFGESAGAYMAELGYAPDAAS